MASRTWVKLYCDRWLEGTIREDSPEVRALFIDILALAGSGKYADTGEVKLQNGVGLTQLQLQKLLSMSKFLIRNGLKRLQETGRISINSAGVITIINWTKYQSEYLRQRPYRNEKLQVKVQQNWSES